MKLIVNQVSVPESISFNYEELKQALTAKAETYSAMVYTDADISAAKKDRADLNKFKKAVNDERIRLEKEFMQPFNDFKTKINEIIKIIDEPINVIDTQVKGFEEQKKFLKMEAIKDVFLAKTSPFSEVTLEKIFNEKWLNASVKMSTVEAEIDARLKQIETDLSTLANLPDFSFEAIETYKHTLDINKSIAEGKRLSDMQKLKAQMQAEDEERLKKAWEAEQARQAAEAEKEPISKVETTEASPAQWVSFKAFMTVEQALMLKDFFDSNNIKFTSI